MIKLDIELDGPEMDQICAELLIPPSLLVCTECTVTFKRRLRVTPEPAEIEVTIDYEG
jgi:hypothetical protein